MTPDIDPAGFRALACAVLELGVHDVMDGDPGAISWLSTRDFDHWCTLLDIDPNAARTAIKARRAERPAKYSDDSIRQAAEYHRQGATWKQAVAWATGNKSENVYRRVVTAAGKL